MLEPGDTILALCSKVGGGHHTYGVTDNELVPQNIYSKLYNFEYYGVNSDGVLDYEGALQKAREVKPKLIIAGASSYPRTVYYYKFKTISDEVGAYLMADIAHGFGLNVAGVANSPFPYADVVTASTNKSMRGPRAGIIYSKKKYEKQIDNGVFPGVMGAPQNNLIGSLATSFKYCKTPQYREYAERSVENCRALADELQLLGNKIVTGGTDTNIMMWDVKSHGINDATMMDLGESCNILYNGCRLPDDNRTHPSDQGGVRFGTNIVSARNYQPED
jgi:glycine hydroxymethyltransferase